MDRFVGDLADVSVLEQSYIFRSYNPRTGTIHFWGKVFDILAVVTEARRILQIADEQIAKWPPRPTHD